MNVDKRGGDINKGVNEVRKRTRNRGRSISWRAEWWKAGLGVSGSATGVDGAKR